MKKYQAPLGRCHELKHEHPERTAQQTLPGLWGDVQFQVWPNRASMAKSIRMQQKRAAKHGDWTPLIPLTDGEGY